MHIGGDAAASVAQALAADRFVVSCQADRGDADEHAGYGSHSGFVNAVKTAAHELVEERFLLKVDADADISAAEASNVLQ